MVRIEGLERLTNSISNLPHLVEDEVEDALEQATSLLEDVASEYPLPPPNSSYRRTGTLGRRWNHTVEKRGSEIRGIVDNPTKYGPYVMGPADQAEVHKGRWLTTDEILINSADQLNDIFQGAADKITNKLAGD